MTKQIYYPKYNIILINGNDIFIDSFVCFLDKIYITPTNNIKEAKIILNSCLYSCFAKTIAEIFQISKNYNNIVFYYSLDLQNINNEIFKYISKDKFINIIKQFIFKYKKEFYFYKSNKNLIFNTILIPRIKITGEEQEILNVINKKLIHKPTLT